MGSAIITAEKVEKYGRIFLIPAFSWGTMRKNHREE
jgi:hypothetical protein